MDRRESLKQIVLLMGGTLSAPALVGLLSASRASAAEVDWKPRFLTPEQAVLVAEVAEIFIPRTDTPGAKDIGIAAFIDGMLHDVYPEKDRRRFLQGLAGFARAEGSNAGHDFLRMDASQQSAYVRAVHDAAIDARRRSMPGQVDEALPFILMLKELTLIGFFTSEAGATQVLQHVAVPGRLLACIPLAEAGNGRTWAE
jgi:hypothetical protein